MKEHWDLEEKVGYKKYKYNDTEINILIDQKNNHIALMIMKRISDFIDNIAYNINKNFHKLPLNIVHGALLFILIHPHRYSLFEIPPNSMFLGLNKPKFVYTDLLLPSVGKDKRLKATERYLFLQLRNKNGQFKNQKEIFDTLIHELVHTMANHVTWREDDHGSDFIKYNKFLTNFCNLMLK